MGFVRRSRGAKDISEAPGKPSVLSSEHQPRVGWLGSISAPRLSGDNAGLGSIFVEHVLNDLIKHFWRNGLLDEVPRSALQRRYNIFLVPN